MIYMVDNLIILDNDDAILLKKVLAKNLYEKGLEQAKIAGILNLTQPMVSNYISSKVDISDNLKMYADKILTKIEGNANLYFQTSISFNRHYGEKYIADESEVLSEEKKEIIRDLTDAFYLLKGKDIGQLLPEVKINLALSKKNPNNLSDIASFLNGIIMLDDKVSSINSIQFGKSKHLASLLLYLKSINKNINSIMNLKFDISLKNKGLSYSYLTPDYKIEDNCSFDILLHKGDFGIEPCSYVLGNSAKEVANKVLSLL